MNVITALSFGGISMSLLAIAMSAMEQGNDGQDQLVPESVSVVSDQASSHDRQNVPVKLSTQSSLLSILPGQVSDANR